MLHLAVRAQHNNGPVNKGHVFLYVNVTFPMLSFKAQHNKCQVNIGFTINPNQQVRANPAKHLARETLIIIYTKIILLC